MKNKEYWITWLKAAGIRSVKTVAQSAIGAIGASAILTQVDWKVVVSTAVLSGIVSILTSITGLPEVTVPEYKE